MNMNSNKGKSIEVVVQIKQLLLYDMIIIELFARVARFLDWMD